MVEREFALSMYVVLQCRHLLYNSNNNDFETRYVLCVKVYLIAAKKVPKISTDAASEDKKSKKKPK